MMCSLFRFVCVCVCVCMYVCMLYACMYVFMYIHMYVHMYMYSSHFIWHGQWHLHTGINQLELPQRDCARTRKHKQRATASEYTWRI